MNLANSAALSLAILLSTSCSSTTSGTGSTSGGFAGAYNATFTGTYQNTSPNNDSGSSSSTAVITVTNVGTDEIQLSWQIAPNPASGAAIFQMAGSNGALVDAGVPAIGAGSAVGGSCFTGVISNGNTQTNCCTQCTISFNGTTFMQPNAGFYNGTTPAGAAYTGTYSGTWSATKQ